jgi:hypothetical protein
MMQWILNWKKKNGHNQTRDTFFPFSKKFTPREVFLKWNFYLLDTKILGSRNKREKRIPSQNFNNRKLRAKLGYMVEAVSNY